MKNFLQSKWISGLAISFLCLSLSACPKKQTVKKTLEPAQKVQEVVETEELDVHGKDFETSKNLDPIYFDYDSSDLSSEARQILSSNTEYIKKLKNSEFLVEGHCDERGTIAYNLALAQKRAQAVRKYYLSLGLDPKKVGTLSYGKEKPICVESSEECWLKNRRAESKLLAPKVANGSKTSEKNQTER